MWSTFYCPFWCSIHIIYSLSVHIVYFSQFIREHELGHAVFVQNAVLLRYDVFFWDAVFKTAALVLDEHNIYRQHYMPLTKINVFLGRMSCNLHKISSDLIWTTCTAGTILSYEFSGLSIDYVHLEFFMGKARTDLIPFGRFSIFSSSLRLSAVCILNLQSC